MLESWAGSRRVTALAWLVLILGLGVAVGRVGLATVPRAGPAAATWVMTDFYSSAYYPTRAVMEGVNPHDRERFMAQYPVADAYPPYLPLNFALHFPFALLPPREAGFAYFLLNIGLTLLLTFLALRLTGVPATGVAIGLVAGLLLLSRPGQWGLLLGQPALLLAILIYLTLLLLQRAPLWSALPLAVASYKPTWGVVLALILLVAGHVRVVLTAGVIAFALNLPLLVHLAGVAGGLGKLFVSVGSGYAAWQARPFANPATSAWLVDATSLLSRMLGRTPGAVVSVAIALGVTVVAGLVVARLRWEDAFERNLAIGIVCTALLVAGHHSTYDLVLLAAPAAALAAGGLAEVPAPVRRTMGVLYLIPAINWFATQGAIDALHPSRGMWLAMTSANAVCLLLLFLAHVGIAVARRQVLAPAGARVLIPS